MNDRKYREYSREFKLEALELLKRGDKNAPQLERELGITPGLLLKWRTRYQILAPEGQPPQLGPSDMEAAKAEIRRLQRELAAAEEERERDCTRRRAETPRRAPGRAARALRELREGVSRLGRRHKHAKRNCPLPEVFCFTG